MESIVSYPDRGNYGNSRYRGNCSGRLIEDIIDQYKVKQLSDFMVGGGTTKDVCNARGIPGTFTDLRLGYDMLSMDIPERSQAIFFHPAYHNIIRYADSMYSAKEVLEKYGIDANAEDLSQCSSYEEFLQKLNYCVEKQYASLEKGGRLFMLVGDIKKSGKLYSMVCDILKPNLEQIIIKAQHNCTSDRKAYTNYNFVPIVHEYLIVCKKDGGRFYLATSGDRSERDTVKSKAPSWRDVIISFLEDKGCDVTLNELYLEMQASPKTKTNPHWQEKIRQTVQNEKYFTRTAKGTYRLAS